jgi:hypothetical protein
VGDEPVSARQEAVADKSKCYASIFFGVTGENHEENAVSEPLLPSEVRTECETTVSPFLQPILRYTYM